MSIKYTTTSFVALFSLLAYANMTFRFEVPSVDAQKIYFDFSFPVGACDLYAQKQGLPIQIQGQMQESDLHNVKFMYEPQGEDYLVMFGLYNQTKLSMSDIEEEYAKKQWQVALSPEKTFGLKLNYGWGNSTVDLSGLPVSIIELNTGHANVNLSYEEKQLNPVAMTSFKTKVDFGSLTINRLDMANTPDFTSEIGVGKLSLSFSEELSRNCQVSVNVGAGSFYAKLPSKDNGVIIKMDDSFVSTVKIPSGFHKKDGYYVNQAYLDKEYAHLVTFDISVSMGKVVFEQTQ